VKAATTVFAYHLHLMIDIDPYSEPAMNDTSRTLVYLNERRFMKTSAFIILTMLTVINLVGADSVEEAKDLALIKAEMERLSPNTPVEIELRHVSYENGVIGSAFVKLVDVVVPNTHTAHVNVVIKRHSDFTKWKNETDHNGWVFPRSSDKAIYHTLYRRFKVGDTSVDLQVPDDLSYADVAGALVYMHAETGEINFHKIEKKGNVIVIRTIEHAVNRHAARGSIYEVELNEIGKPVKITKLPGSWNS
jgi:hypothetical protein